MKSKSCFFLFILSLSILACTFPASTPSAPTVNPLPPTPDLPFSASSVTQTSPALLKNFSVSVPASACWTSSGVNVLAGQRVGITASGTVNTWNGNAISYGDPNGQPENICAETVCPLQGTGYGALVGRLENLKPFLVGTAVEFTATNDGQLYFTVNDWECSDNSGTFELVITIE
ncbi:MAG: hypothetical protein HYU84_12930 [Chloroflexi bacterium]|nr:hypothetical protein [Chloroflexota bacterium]